jgi:nucleoside-diphosphate-sugar epimerase
MNSTLHVIFGTGPVGIWTARALREMGHLVRAINRSGQRQGLMPADVEIVAADASDVRQAIKAARGASVLYQTLNPPYDRWTEMFPPLQRVALEAARSAGARYVSIDNLYGYGRVSGTLTERTPQAPHTKKGRLRAAMTRVAVLQPSDYFGPGVTASQLGARTFPPMLAGKPADVTGRADLPHSPLAEGLKRTIEWWKKQ